MKLEVPPPPYAAAREDTLKQFLDGIYSAEPEVERPLFIDQTRGQHWVRPLTQVGGIAFVTQILDNPDPSGWRSSPVSPTAVLSDGGRLILFFAFDVFWKPERVADIALALGMRSFHELVACPG